MRLPHFAHHLIKFPARALIIIIAWYQRLFSPDTGFVTALFGRRKPTCAFYPTCSVYTQEALVKYGFFKGLALGIRRILRCHPWQKDHFDPIP